MIEWDAARIAAAAGARVIRDNGEVAAASEPAAPPGEPDPLAGPGPRRVTIDALAGPQRVRIDSRDLEPGDLFVGLPGERVDGGAFAEQALRAGAWGVLVTPEHAAGVTGATSGVVLAHPDPLVALQALARAWRRELGAKVVAITGSTGKTSTKDILAAVLTQRLRTTASPQNLNTEIGLPLAVLAAPRGSEALVLEMAMRGPGQIAELVTIAEPDVGVIVNVGPVHLELLGSIEAIAAAKAELIAGLAPDATIVVPAGEPLLAPHLRTDLRTVTFGEGGDVELVRCENGRDEATVQGENASDEAASRTAALPQGGSSSDAFAHRRAVAIAEHGSSGEDLVMVLEPSFSQSHNLRNLLAAVAAARALGVTPDGRLDVTFSALRGERIALADGIVLINDCYNANPMSMRAALDDLATSAPGRRVAVLGDMLELGAEQGPALHREVAAYASERGVELLLAVGSQAAEMGEVFPHEVLLAPNAQTAAELLGPLLRAGDTVLVKGSRGVGLERVAEVLAAADASAPDAAATHASAPDSSADGAR